MNDVQSENKRVLSLDWKPPDDLESGIRVWDDRVPSEEHILGIVLRFQALQTGIIATEECTRLRIVELADTVRCASNYGLGLGLRT